MEKAEKPVTTLQYLVFVSNKRVVKWKHQDKTLRRKEQKRQKRRKRRKTSKNVENVESVVKRRKRQKWLHHVSHDVDKAASLKVIPRKTS